MVLPKATASGSTSVACWLVEFVYGSLLSWVSVGRGGVAVGIGLGVTTGVAVGVVVGVVVGLGLGVWFGPGVRPAAATGPGPACPLGVKEPARRAATAIMAAASAANRVFALP
jgi:hypothetical protein